MAMKRFSGFLKRPEILGKILIRIIIVSTSFLETVYSVEEEEKQKSEEKPDEEPNKEVVDDKVDEDVYDKVKEDELVKKEKIAWKEDDFETTEYDCSTDDDSFRMIYSSTDQVQSTFVTDSLIVYK